MKQKSKLRFTHSFYKKTHLILYIALNNIQLFAFHGLYPEEKILGNHFLIDCKAGIEHKKIESIDDTIDYALLLHIIKKHFAIPTPLLETLAEKIEHESKEIFPALKYFFISIKKMNPALNARLHSSEITLEKNY